MKERLEKLPDMMRVINGHLSLRQMAFTKEDVKDLAVFLHIWMEGNAEGLAQLATLYMQWYGKSFQALLEATTVLFPIWEALCNKTETAVMEGEKIIKGFVSPPDEISEKLQKRFEERFADLKKEIEEMEREGVEGEKLS